MLKLAGLCIVFCSLAGMGLSMARGVKREWEMAQALLAFVRRIGSDVRCYKRPLPEIYDGFEGALPPLFLKKLQNASPKEALAALPLDPAVEAAALPFFERVGRCSAEECRLFEEQCTKELERLILENTEAVAEKAKMYRSLGLAGGAVVLILLL